MFLTRKNKSKIQGSYTRKYDHSTGAKGGSAFLVKHGLVISPSFSKPFSTHTLYQGGRADPRRYLKNRCPHQREILQDIRDTSESPINVKVVYIVFTWLS